MTKERVTFWRDAALANMEVLKATYVTHTFSRHSHEGYAIGVIESGVEAFEYLGGVYQAPADTLVIVHPGEVHTGYAGIPGGWQYRMAYPSVTLMQQAMTALSPSTSLVPFFPAPVIADIALVRQFRQLHRASEQGVSVLERESRMLWFMAQLIHQYGELRSPMPPSGNDPCAFRQVLTYLHEHSDQPVGLNDLAIVAKLSPLQILRLFNKTLGLPPHRYLIQIRVEHAKRQIAAGLPLSAVAVRVGFADQSHLNRHFKRLVGVTPGQYQRGC